MAAPARDELRASARLVDRMLRMIEDTSHSLRQKLLARRLGRTSPSEHWKPAANHEHGLSADDLRRHASEVRHNATE